MTRDEAIEKHEHQFAGMVLDAWSQQRTGEAQVIFVRMILAKARRPLGEAYDAGYKAATEEFERLNKPVEKRELFNEGNKKARGKDHGE